MSENTPTPGPIPASDRENFNTLQRAAKDNRLAAVSAIRKSDGKEVTLLCAMSSGEDDDYIYPVPLAVMVEGNPFEDYHDPTAS